MASNETDPDIAPTLIREKGRNGVIQEWALNDESPAFRERRRRLERRTPPRNDRRTPFTSHLRAVERKPLHHITGTALPGAIPGLVTPSLEYSKLDSRALVVLESTGRGASSERQGDS